MNWSGIIAAVLAVVGPLLKRWLADWLDGLLKRVAVQMRSFPTGATAADARALLEAAYRELWWFQLPKRRLLATLIEAVPPAVVAGRLPDAQRAAVAALAAKCG